MKESLEIHTYTRRLLADYLRLPDTGSHGRASDRNLAQQLHRRKIPLQTVQQAFLLATARRRFRSPDAPPLQPIRSLHYFLPVIEELLQTPLPQAYAQYLKAKLATFSSSPKPQPSSPPATGDRSKTRVSY
jgi:hypothetical protein